MVKSESSPKTVEAIIFLYWFNMRTARTILFKVKNQSFVAIEGGFKTSGPFLLTVANWDKGTILTKGRINRLVLDWGAANQTRRDTLNYQEKWEISHTANMIYQRWSKLWPLPEEVIKYINWQVEIRKKWNYRFSSSCSHLISFVVHFKNAVLAFQQVVRKCKTIDFSSYCSKEKNEKRMVCLFFFLQKI